MRSDFLKHRDVFEHTFRAWIARVSLCTVAWGKWDAGEAFGLGGGVQPTAGLAGDDVELIGNPLHIERMLR